MVVGHSSDPLGLLEIVGTSFSRSSVQYLELVPVSLRQENSDVTLLLEVLYSVLDTHG